MTSTRKLRLGPLPKAESVKFTFLCPVELKDDLERYAALHSRVYGDAADAAALVPHMLEAFMRRDRVFKRSVQAPGTRRETTSAPGGTAEPDDCVR